jgi:hypothetical protein
MIYVLINNNQVINGPRAWNYRSFESTLEDDLEITTKLPLQKTDNDPIIIDEDTKILPATLIYQDYNPKIQYLNGPFWEFSDTLATGTFVIEPNNIDAVKNDLISKVAANRYAKEISGVKVTIQNTEVTIDTARGNRDIFVQKYLLMSDTDTVQWKFPECWLTLTKSDLGLIVSTGATFVQEQFNWEEGKVVEIKACTTLEELDAVILAQSES